MSIERERGISVVTSVMTFEYADCVFNLLDTPGHEDFSEDTYRTLTAVDAAVMVIDAAKGIEARTRKLFEVCRLRDIPIVTFINKLDREGRDPFELLDEIEKTLALDTDADHLADRRRQEFRRHLSLRDEDRPPDRQGRRAHCRPTGSTIRVFDTLLPNGADALARGGDAGGGGLQALRSRGLPRGPSDAGVLRLARCAISASRDLIDAMAEYAPSPRAQEADKRMVEADEPKMTGFVFKIQANMDPNHRDRIAFMRVCSGKLTRGMKAKLMRTGKNIPLNAPQFFFARDRSIADEAFAGDVVGMPNHGQLRIGDTLTEGEDIVFRGVPSFAPEILRRILISRRDEGEEAARGAAAAGGGGRRAGVHAA